MHMQNHNRSTQANVHVVSKAIIVISKLTIPYHIQVKQVNVALQLILIRCIIRGKSQKLCMHKIECVFIFVCFANSWNDQRQTNKHKA